MRYITLKQLRALDACPGGLKRFKQRFPSGRVAVTIANAERYAQVFDIVWLAPKMLTPAQWNSYIRASKRNWERFDRDCNKIWEEYKLSGYNLGTAYNSKMVAATSKYRRANAVAFAILYGGG
jgi:hypothetical protein